MRTPRLAALGVAILGAGGCQIVGNIQDHDADPILQGARCRPQATPRCASPTWLTPYAGQFGAAPPPPDPSGGWANEQDLQAQQWVSFVKSHSSGRPAIILGELASSSPYPADAGDGGTVQLAALNPSAIGQLQSAFKEAIAQDYTPACTLCPPPANPSNGPGPGRWTNRIFTTGFHPNAAVSSAIGFNQLVVPGGPNGTKLPLSDTFAYEVRLLRP